LLAILVDHLNYYTGNSIFTFYNGNGRLWVSAAEGFVFLSGFFVSYVYYPKLAGGAVKNTFKILFKKSRNLYLWSIFLTLGYTALALNTNRYPMTLNVDSVSILKDLVLNTLILRHVYGWADILVLYIPLLLLAPIILLLFKKRLSWLVLALSVLIWSLNFKNTNCTLACVSFFELTSWQLIFVLGMLAGFYKDNLAKLYRYIKEFRLIKYSIVLLFIITVLLSVLNNISDNYKYPSDLLFNTETLGIGRIIIFALWFTVFYMFIEKYKTFITKYLGWLYLTLGQNSLRTYIVQSTVLFGFFYLPLPYSFWLNSIYYLFAILVTWLTVTIYNKSLS